MNPTNATPIESSPLPLREPRTRPARNRARLNPVPAAECCLRGSRRPAKARWRGPPRATLTGETGVPAILPSPLIRHSQFLYIVVDDSEAVYPLTIDPVAQQAYLKASNIDGGDEFGLSVAVSGDTVVVGAPDEDSSATGVNGNQGDNSALDAGAGMSFTVCLAGDANGDFTLDSDDVSGFVSVLLDPGSAIGYPACAADVNGDGDVDGHDVQAFVNTLLG